jgi:hypothetical protein
MEWTFEVEGPLVGHKCSKSRCFSAPVIAFKRLVRWKANLAGVPQELDPNETYSLCTQVFWAKKAKIDTENVHKLTGDGCFGKDRRVLHGAYTATEYAGVERAIVTVKVEGKQNGRRDSGRVRTRR